MTSVVKSYVSHHVNTAHQDDIRINDLVVPSWQKAFDGRVRGFPRNIIPPYSRRTRQGVLDMMDTIGAPPPPVHAINRGIGTEGLGTVLAGLWGSGNGTNTFGENVGAIGVTKIGSRRVIQYAGFLMVIQGVISKFGAVFIIIPEPVVGGMFCVMFGMIAAFGLSALQYVDLNSSRNLYILGFSIFFGLVLPKWMQANPNIIVTGSEVADGIFTVLLSTSILVGG
ncbi:unnamed protein product, partial [Timema podura]|nr:unnamed protein product [Timema podura]